MKHRSLFAAALGFFAIGTSLQAWDYTAHRMVNQIALNALPADFPAFVREPVNAERIAFLAGEPDRWRNAPDLILKQSGGSWTDHFCDLEQLTDAGMALDKVPSFRFDFVVQFAAGRAAHPDKFAPIDAAKNLDHTREWPGFAPWAIAEYFSRIRSGFAYLKVFEELGTPEEIANAKANLVYQMGVLGHFVGDCAQPLHTTVHHNGWVGPNPHGYTTGSGIHSWIDGGFIAKAGITLTELTPKVTTAPPISLATRADGREPLFVAVMDYLIASQKLVEPLYAMDKAGKFRIEGTNPPSEEGRAFITGRLLTGGEMLGAIWLTAWKSAPPDTYLRSQLIKRQDTANRTPPPVAPAAKS
jgi:hypothetical protein